MGLISLPPLGAGLLMKRFSGSCGTSVPFLSLFQRKWALVWPVLAVLKIVSGFHIWAFRWKNFHSLTAAASLSVGIGAVGVAVSGPSGLEGSYFSPGGDGGDQEAG